jgi:hypothetical protein
MSKFVIHGCGDCPFAMINFEKNSFLCSHPDREIRNIEQYVKQYIEGTKEEILYPKKCPLVLESTLIELKT